MYCALDSKISFIFTTVYKKILDPIFMVQVLKARDSIIETNGMGFLYLDKIVVPTLVVPPLLSRMPKVFLSIENEIQILFGN